jgi:hypothetical protein
MSGVEIYPIISLILFFVVFVTMVMIVLKMPKTNIEEMSNLPLDNQTNNIEND